MSAKIPESYKAGIQFIEGLNTENIAIWLEGELKEINHVLAGGRDDQPVQAIVNHHPYLSRETQKRLADAIGTLILSWKETPADWTEDAGRALLSLAAEIRISAAKYPLQSLIKDKKAFIRVVALQAEVLRTIATLSTNGDAVFWRDLCRIHEDFSGMAFQVLTRIDPHEAISLLGELPANEAAVGGVARKLPDFVSQQEGKRQNTVLTQISEALGKLPPESVMALHAALKEEGFDLGEIVPPTTAQHLAAFLQRIIPFARTLRRGSELNHLYARAHQ